MSVSHTVVTRFCADCRQTYPYKEVHLCPMAPTVPAPIIAKPEDELLGTVLGDRYRIESFVQRGGMGTVYLARHIVLDKPVAIKVLNEAKDEVAQKRFLLEAKAACHVNHEHIVNITDYGVLSDSRPYLAMEYLQGQALDALIAKGPLPFPRVCRIGEQIALGLQAVHEKGILHRDLKPANVYLLERHRRDYVKILDFGIAKVVSDAPADGAGPDGVPYRPTQEGMVLGTAEYLAPEQALGEPLDHRVDQYALGCILYEMLTGEVPWKGNTTMATVVKRLNEEPQPPRQRKPELGIPASLEAIAMRALSRDREKRFASMNDLAVALNTELESLGYSPGESSGSFQASAIAPLLETAPRLKKLNVETLPSPSPSSSTVRTQLDRPMLSALLKPWLLPRPWGLAFALGVATIIVGISFGLLLRMFGEPVQTSKPDAKNPITTQLPATDSQKPSEGDVIEAPRPGLEASGDKDHPSGKNGEAELGTKITFENASTVELNIACTHQPTCIITPKNSCSVTFGNENGRCEATAPGHKPQILSFRELRQKVRSGRSRQRISLDAKGLGELKL